MALISFRMPCYEVIFIFLLHGREIGGHWRNKLDKWRLNMTIVALNLSVATDNFDLVVGMISNVSLWGECLLLLAIIRC